MNANRRDFLGNAFVAAAAAGAVKFLSSSKAEGADAVAMVTAASDTSSASDRERALKLRKDVAQQNHDATPSNLEHPTNGDEDLYANRIGSFSKGLQHDSNAEVVASSYRSLLNAVTTRGIDKFEAIELGGAAKLINPQGGIAYELMGGDARSFVQPPPPAFASRTEAAEIAENYWMALLRDVPFAQYSSSAIAAAAALDLSSFGADSKVPKDASGNVTPDLLFRGFTAGDRVGPYLSQFFYQPLALGANVVDQRITSYATGVDYLTSFGDYLAVQRGGSVGSQLAGATVFMHRGRDIGAWVHVDVLYQAYFHAALILLSSGAPLNPGNPYRTSKTQIPFGTLGAPQVAGLLGEVAQRALHGVWYQKWFVHRRLRPENFAARAHQVLYLGAPYPVHSDILTSLSTASRLGGYLPAGTALLPVAFPEGCPTHPSYGAGHATVAGACVTVLKAWFDGSVNVSNPLQPNSDGTALVAYSGALSVEGELNKVASNVALGRNIAGVHWRSDATESLKLGESIAIQYLKELKQTYNEQVSFRFNDFAGRAVVI